MADPGKLNAALERATRLQREGQVREALAAFQDCLALAPANALAHAHAGLASAHLEDWPRGIGHLRVAVAAAPHVAEGWMHLSSALQHVGRLDDAERLARQAVSMKPSLAGAWNTLGMVALERRRHEEGIPHFRRALAEQPDFAIAHVNLGCCEQALGHDDEAVASFRRALAIDPALASAHYNLGAFEHGQGRPTEAMEHYLRAIASRRNDAQSHFNLALGYFITGRFEEGWREYAWRPQRRERPDYAPPSPSQVAGVHVAILAEQGLGDVLFFLRYATALRPRAAGLEFVGDQRLHPMLARTGLFETLARQPEDLPERTRIGVLAGDLPLLVPDGTTMTPAPLALTPDSAKVQAMRVRVAALGPPPYVALAWRAGEPKSGRIDNLFKQVDIAALGAALKGAPATWIAVQRDPAPGEIDALSEALGAPVHDFSGVNADLEDALALLAVADDYVGVSSSLVHLRAGLGGPARVLVPLPYEWRWMASGDASPWFPRAVVYRQGSDRDWSAALRRLHADFVTRR